MQNIFHFTGIVLLFFKNYKNTVRDQPSALTFFFGVRWGTVLRCGRWRFAGGARGR